MQTKQEVFDYVVSKMREQSKQCRTTYKLRYLSEDLSLASPIGLMIGAKDGYDKIQTEKYAATILFGLNTPLNQSFVENNKPFEDLLVMMNNIHDMYEAERWEEGWEETAKKFNLKYSEPKNKVMTEEEIILPKPKKEYQFLVRHTELLALKEQLVKEMTTINNQALYVAEGFKHPDMFSLEEVNITSILQTDKLTEAFAKYQIAVEKYKIDAMAYYQTNKNKLKAKDIPNGSKIRAKENGVELFGQVVNNKSRMGEDYVVVEWDVNFLCSAVETNKLEVLEN